jgi:RNA polymerase sigma factor (sigma-70 family)
MTRTQLEPVVRHLRRLAAPDRHDPSDAQLLQRFAARREEDAFAALVERHGGLVLGVCRRVLGHEQDAEDAFQATFLVLARNAASIDRTEAVGSWLYRVAHRIATRAGVHMAKQRAREREAGSRRPREAPSEAGWRELQEVLQEELARLPEKYREPFVLCCLEGKSGAEAAALLGWKPGTVTSRLTEARLRLRQRLARRGIVLSAVLTAVALAQRSATASVPATLAGTTVRAAAAFAVGTKAALGGVSPAVAALVRGATRGLLVTRVRTGTALVLLAGLLLGAGVATHTAFASRQPAVPPAAAPADNAAPPPAAAAPDTGRTGVLSGRVMDTEGQPVPGARLSLWTKPVPGRPATPPRTTAGADGRFRLSIPPADLKQGTLVAAAAGYGPDWAGPADLARHGDLTLRLHRDDVPVNGRVLDLEGRPIPGVRVEIVLLQRAPAGGLDEYIRKRQRGIYLHPPGVRPEVLGWPAARTTDADGRFRLTGAGRERIVQLRLQGENLERALVWVLTRTGPLPKLPTGHYGAYGPTFDLILGPSKPIAGTVRDRRTGKPVAGIIVEEATGQRDRATTDAEGHYRLVGVPKNSRGYFVSAGGGKGVPYFDVTKLDIPDTPGWEPLAVDFEMERGVEITGRLTDRATGKPVRGNVHYFTPPTNPNLKDYAAAFELRRILVSDWGRTAPDGTFTVLGIPGPGVLVAGADDVNRFVAIDAPKELSALRIYQHPVQPCHALVRIDVSEKDPKSLHHDIALEPARAVPGTVIGPDGKPLAGTHAAGLGAPRVAILADPSRDMPRSQGLKTAEFTVQGLSPNGSRTLVFFYPEKKLGKVLKVRGDEAGPLTVRLDETGAATGRVVDARGRPWPGVSVSVQVSYNPEDAKDLPATDLFQSGIGRLLEAKVTTDRAGKFRVEGLVPGLPYLIQGSVRNRNGDPFLLFTWGNLPGLAAEPGKTKSLGDVPTEFVPDAEAGGKRP